MLRDDSIDASVAFKWIAREDDSEAALELLDGRPLVAPILLMHEVSNAIWKKVRREQIDRTVSFSEDVARLPRHIELVDESAHVPRALDLARRFDHGVYDCVYLAMAESRADVLITADEKLKRKLSGSSLQERLVSIQQALFR